VVDWTGLAATIAATSGLVTAVGTLFNRRNIKAARKEVATVQDTVNGATLAKERRVEQLTDALTKAGQPIPPHPNPVLDDPPTSDTK
jgi:hypothetical protein